MGTYYLIARKVAREQEAQDRGEFSAREGKTFQGRMHRDLQRGRNSGWRVYNEETSRIIKRNAADVLDVTRLDGGKLDLRG